MARRRGLESSNLNGEEEGRTEMVVAVHCEFTVVGVVKLLYRNTRCIHVIYPSSRIPIILKHTRAQDSYMFPAV
jgi:hypothetical protein